MNATHTELEPESFGTRVLELVETLELTTRLAFVEQLRLDPSGTLVPVAQHRRVPWDELRGGSNYRVHLDGRPTELRLELAEWREGLQTREQAGQAFARVERLLHTLARLRNLNGEVTRVPSPLARLYTAQIDPSNRYLTINPRPRKQRERGEPRSRSRGLGVRVEPTRAGGHRIAVEHSDGRSAQFGAAQWVHTSLRESLAHTLGAHYEDPAELYTRVAAAQRRMLEAGFELDTPRPLLRTQVVGTREAIDFVLSSNPARLSVACVCSEITVLNLSNPVQPAQSYRVRKPVIYFWPREATQLQITLTPSGPFLAQYPKHNAGEGQWTLVATPDGMLREPASERSYAYLFWEAVGYDFELDPAQAHCIASDEAAAFLERVAAAYQLGVRERTDFVSYWLPALEANPHSLVQLLDAQTYARYAPLHVEPEPDSLIRLFMLFRRVAQPLPVGAPELPTHARRGFCVVEWGGVNLDERLSELEGPIE